jgi:putative DNA primase/helicase
MNCQFTDVGNASRFVADHARDLKHVSDWEKWLFWDGTRWAVGKDAVALHRAVLTVQCMLREANQSVSDLQEQVTTAQIARGHALAERLTKRLDQARAQQSWAHKSHAVGRLTAMVRLAAVDPRIRLPSSTLDADDNALNVCNGTIDLLTLDVHPHSQDHLITKLAPTVFNPDAKAPLWDAFLLRAMGGDQTLVDFLSRFVGYSLTGSVREHVLVFFFGDGANGKSTFTATIASILGDYAVRAPRHLLFASRGQRHETELTVIFGARLAVCSEVDRGAQFDEALVKDLTGGETITARRMREDHWTFRPTHKLLLAGNHKPAIQGLDEGIWRRILLVPWTETIPVAERDTELSAKLHAQREGILAWCIRGCQEYLAGGLQPPPAVEAATLEYRRESDPFGEFFEEECTFEPDARCTRADLREAYSIFCDRNGTVPASAHRFAEWLRRHNVTDKKVRTTSGPRDGWCGVRLTTRAERAQRELSKMTA